MKFWFLAKRYPERDGKLLITMLERGLNCPQTSSLGRLFDAAAGLFGFKSRGALRRAGSNGVRVFSRPVRRGAATAERDGFQSRHYRFQTTVIPFG